MLRWSIEIRSKVQRLLLADTAIVDASDADLTCDGDGLYGEEQAEAAYCEGVWEGMVAVGLQYLRGGVWGICSVRRDR